MAGDACSRPPIIIIRFHDLHAGDIREAVGEIDSYCEKDQLSPFFGLYRLPVFLAFL